MALKIAKAQPTPPSDPRASRCEEAERAFADGDLEHAAAIYLELLEDDQDNAELYMLLGVVLYQLQRYDKAVFSLRHAITLAPDMIPAINALGVVLYALGWYAAAEVFFRRVLELDREHQAARQSLIETMRQVRDTGDTIDPGLQAVVALARPRAGRLSLCMIVKNEEAFLEGCLESVRGVVDEICLVDTGSTDRTLEIAERFGAKIGHFPWTGDFSAARNASLDLATGDWVLVLDADERLNEGARPVLDQLMQNPNAAGYSLLIENKLGDEDGHAHQMATIFRLFRNRKDIRFEGRIHEQTILAAQRTGLKTLPSELRITHLGYLQTWMDQRDKLARNHELLVQQVNEEADNPYAHYNLGQTLKMMGEHAEAEVRYREALRLLKAEGADHKIPYYPNLYFNLSDLYRQMKRFQDAYALIDEGLAIYPDFADLIYTKAFTFMDEERYPEAIAQYERCLTFRGKIHAGGTDPSICTYKGHNAIGVCYAKLGEYEKARDHLRLAIAEHPMPDGELLTNLGILTLQLGDQAEAMDLFTRALERNPEEVRAWINLAALASRMHRHAESAAAWEKVVAIDPKLPDARIFLAEALIKTGAIAKAEAALELERAEHPDSRLLWLNLGVVYLATGRREEALAAWGRFPDDPECGGLLSYLLALEGGPLPMDGVSVPDRIRCWGAMTDILLASGQADALQPLLDRVQELGQAVDGFELMLGRVLFKHDLKELALKVFLLGQTHRDRDPHLYAAIGDASAALGYRDDARTMYGRAVEIDPAFEYPRAQLAMLATA